MSSEGQTTNTPIYLTPGCDCKPWYARLFRLSTLWWLSFVALHWLVLLGIVAMDWRALVAWILFLAFGLLSEHWKDAS